MHEKTAARVTGALFLTATAAGVLGAALLGPLESPHSGALLVLVMAGAITLIPAALFPVLKQYGEALALGYLATRLVEVVLLLPGNDPTYLAGSSLFFCLSVLLLNYRLFRSRLVPRWIPGWALVAVVPYLADACLVLFDVLSPSSPVHGALIFPLALNEMVLAVWLVTKGFSVRPAWTEA
jgi:hypothetical protein